MKATATKEINGAPSAVESNQGNAGIVSDSEQLNAEPCIAMDVPCNYRKGYICANDCECPHDARYSARESENTPLNRGMQRATRRAKA
jgi:hypothetical protein